MNRSRLVGALALGALLTAGACSSSSETTTSPAGGSSTTAGTVAAGSTTEVGDLTISDPWCRSVMERGACYLTISSSGGADALVGASVPASVAGTVELHETVMADDMESTGGTMADDMESSKGTMADDMGDEMESTDGTMADDMDDMGGTTDDTMGSGAMSMRPVEMIPVPAGGSVELKPGGYHVMLLDVPEPLEVGSDVALTLTFEEAGEVTVQAEVRDA